ncbi:MAG: hypothetical protein HY282_12460 [Nitrospirae bacterium]|nr:hypothetical protein [Candidatus Manganitrophaceae bacterium]
MNRSIIFTIAVSSTATYLRRVGTARVDLKFDRVGDRRIKTTVVRVDAKLDVQIEEGTGAAM